MFSSLPTISSERTSYHKRHLGFFFFSPHLSCQNLSHMCPSLIHTAPVLVQAFNTPTIAIASPPGSLPLDVSHQSTCIPVSPKQYFHCITPQLESLSHYLWWSQVPTPLPAFHDPPRTGRKHLAWLPSSCQASLLTAPTVGHSPYPTHSLPEAPLARNALPPQPHLSKAYSSRLAQLSPRPPPPGSLPLL